MGVAVGGVWSPQATDRMMTMIPAAIQPLDISNISLPSKMTISSVPQSRIVYQIGTLRGCLLLWLIGFSALERAVPRTPRCRPFFELAGGRRLSTFIEENPLRLSSGRRMRTNLTIHAAP